MIGFRIRRSGYCRASAKLTGQDKFTFVGNAACISWGPNPGANRVKRSIAEYRVVELL